MRTALPILNAPHWDRSPCPEALVQADRFHNIRHKCSMSSAILLRLPNTRLFVTGQWCTLYSTPRIDNLSSHSRRKHYQWQMSGSFTVKGVDCAHFDTFFPTNRRTWILHPPCLFYLSLLLPSGASSNNYHETSQVVREDAVQHVYAFVGPCCIRIVAVTLYGHLYTVAGNLWDEFFQHFFIRVLQRHFGASLRRSRLILFILIDSLIKIGDMWRFRMLQGFHVCGHRVS